MKYSMEKIILVLLIAAVSTFHACQDRPGDNDTKDTATVKSDRDTTVVANTKEKDGQVVSDLIAANSEEVKLAELAKKKSMNKEVKHIADMLVKDHTAALGDLRDLANRKGLTLAAEDTAASNKAYRDLDDEKGKEFDKEWCSKLTDKHKNTIDKLEGLSNDNIDQDIKTWASNILPKIRTHHDMLMACKDKMK